MSEINKFPKLQEEDKSKLISWLNREITQARKEMSSYGACENYSAALQFEHRISDLNYIKMIMEYHEE